MADTRLCCRVKHKRKSDDLDPYFTEETTMARSASTSAMLSRSDLATKAEHSVSRDPPETDRLCECEKFEQKTSDCTTAPSCRGESQQSEMAWVHLPASINDVDDLVNVPTSLMRSDSDWQPRGRSHRVYDRLVQRYRSAEMSEFDHTQTDSDSESSVSGGMIPIASNLEDDDFDVVSQLGLGPWHEWFNLEQNPDGQRERSEGPQEELLYPQGDLTETECYVCFEEASLHRRLCCDFPVCDPCLESYLTVQVSQANVNIECLNINCNSYIHRSEISARLPAKMKMKFYKFLIDANIDPTVKTCPRCSSGLQVDKVTLKKRKVLKNGLLVTCQRCGLEWCFTCHSPWHKGLTCKQFRKGDVLLKDWAREFHYGQLNAQKCPKCKIFIQRSLGCDHMTCSRCDTSFCYRCGENYRGFKLLGNHFSRLSPFGCRYNFMPDAPHLRRLIRGAVLGGKLIGGLALSGFVVAAGAFLLGVSVVALPAWGGYKLHKRRKYRQRLRAHCKYAKQNLALRNLQAKKAAETSVPVLSGPVLDSSDSTADFDDSSDENRDHIIVGLQLPDSQRVEVLVHRTVGSSSEHEETSAPGNGREVMAESSIIFTDVQEVVDEDGYTTVVANVYARSCDRDLSSAAFEGEESDSSQDSDEEAYMHASHQNAKHSVTGNSKGHSASEKSNSPTTSKNPSQSDGKNKCAEVTNSFIDDSSRTVLPDTPGSRTVLPDTPGSRTVLPDTPGSRTVLPDTPGSRTVLPDTPGSRTVLPDTPDKAPEACLDAQQSSSSKSHERKEVNETDAGLHQEKKAIEKETDLEKEKKATEKETGISKEKKAFEKETGISKEKKAVEKETGVGKEKKAVEKETGVGKEKKATEKETGVGKEKKAVEKETGVGKEKKAVEKETGVGKEKKAVEKETGVGKEKKAIEKETGVGKEKKEKLCEHAWTSEKREKEAVTCTDRREKHSESGEKNEKRVRDKDRESLANRKPVDQRDTGLLSKENSNGCFGNIFSKKITVIQISGRRNTIPQSEAPKPGNVCNMSNKSATWEKGHDNSTTHKPKAKMDIRDVSHFNEKLPCQTSDPSVGLGPKTGVLLQDFVVISASGDFSSQDWGGGDSTSVSSSLSADEVGGFREEGAGERESSCCLSASDSFRGSNLSCDIVTYL